MDAEDAEQEMKPAFLIAVHSMSYYNSEGECVNSSKTEFLTDNFEDALKQSVINNNELLNFTSYSRGSMTSHLTSKENYK